MVWSIHYMLLIVVMVLSLGCNPQRVEQACLHDGGRHMLRFSHEKESTIL